MLQISHNQFFKKDTNQPIFNKISGQNALAFHQKIDGYAPTPLQNLTNLAAYLGLNSIVVKDESKRFGLNAFKGLGGSFALGKMLAQKLNLNIDEINLKTVSEKLAEPLTFVTATAGNHGTGVAWAAREMQQNAIVYMPKGSSQASVNRINGLGATCIVTEVNYDDTVRLASKVAQEKGYTLVQDTAWDGYTEIPTWISQGYTTMAAEVLTQLEQQGLAKPTHVFLQAGVGSFAGGILGYLRDALGYDFTAIIVEPEFVDCIYRSGAKGEIENITGELKTIMAGLACGEPNPVTWATLRDSSNFFAKCSDSVSATGIRVLASPLGNDPRIISGESGAIGLGALYKALTSKNHAEFRQQLGLDETSNVLIFSTEGDTNPKRWQEIVWNGAYNLKD